MIVNATENTEKFENIIRNSDFLGKKIYADYISQQLKETNSFNVGDNTAFMLSGTNLTLCGKLTGDELEEILMFCNFCGVKSIESQIPGLPMNIDRVLHIMEYAGTAAEKQQYIVVNDDNYSFIKFCCSNFHNLNFDIVYSNLARKINRGISNTYHLKHNGVIVAGAISTIYDEDTVYITFVSTRPEYRKQGYAEKVIKHIIAENADKKVILKCEDALKPYYEKIGFKAVGTVKLYKE